jgi:septum formation protein
MLVKKLKNYKIYLCSISPRRHELLKGMDVEFESLPTHMDETHPEGLTPLEVAEYLSKHKLSPILFDEYEKQSIFIACDTIVVIEDMIIEKPKNKADALRMLQLLSGKEHTVISGLTVANKKKSFTSSRTSIVKFKDFTDEELHYYINKYKPFDKAGSYGIQEWIGYIGIEYIQGSFYNVMGLPTKLLWEMLDKITKD